MDLKQILIFGLLIASVWTDKMYRCYGEHELDDVAERKLRTHYRLLQPADTLPSQASDTPAVCPVELFQQATPDHISGRSVSPWRYILKTLKDHFPSTYTEAQCLCSGCILIQDNSVPDKRPLPVESYDYNSVPIKQSKVFLKRELCSDGKKYSLKPVTLNVAVGCTCARVKTSSS
uniref:Interleukin 17C n=1 Tax=Miichthys miiuy TaxID=240162 RepID=A0A0U3SL79_MIIMI|nr:interleukin 17C [Miichthys miiuy]